jgi:hypothetical protein
MRKFLTDWAGTRTAENGWLFLADIGRTVLADYRAEWPKEMTPGQRDAAALKLIRFRETWSVTMAAADANAMLGELGEQEVDAFKATWPATPNPAQSKAIIDRLKLLQKKWESTTAADRCAVLLKDLGAG